MSEPKVVSTLPMRISAEMKAYSPKPSAPKRRAMRQVTDHRVALAPDAGGQQPETVAGETRDEIYRHLFIARQSFITPAGVENANYTR
ncbi:MAG: hypothetical protein U0X87_06805 [Anaerolineales bacterium]